MAAARRTAQRLRLNGATRSSVFRTSIRCNSSFSPAFSAERVSIEQPVPTTSPRLVALHARVGAPIPVDTFLRALNDNTSPVVSQLGTNSHLSHLGSSILGYYVSEYIITKYPRLPSSILKAALDAFIGVKALKSLAREWGVELFQKDVEVEKQIGRVLFGRVDDRIVNPEREKGQQYADVAAATFVRAVIGGIALHQDRNAARAFIEAHVLSRKLDVLQLFAFTEPNRELSHLCKREGMEAPVSRLVAETGRKSRSPVFVVGVYSGADKLGEGQASSMKEAEFRAAANALKGYYLWEQKDVVLPSQAGPDYKGSFIDKGEVIV
ncbi:hypothetical protein SAICODRAFT_4869 [Saitoella complicata NRRL Y-17804]|nr:uncharacterized protein SAICODRAFT_4869 [Saitoella complicata NRRL Y-17804]ODQ55631.1 hypothetical protein SAICODRAFT_4869 [Saitoella complicata NRRL Y-17804]